jgi:putative addiction module killer protein
LIEVRQTRVFEAWLANLADARAARRITQRIVRLEARFVRRHQVGRGVVELRVDYGPGYRIYFARRGAILVILLCGGDKSTQRRDIEKAIAMAEKLKGLDE